MVYQKPLGNYPSVYAFVVSSILRGKSKKAIIDTLVYRYRYSRYNARHIYMVYKRRYFDRVIEFQNKLSEKLGSTDLFEDEIQESE
jgi:hypothetical protein